MTPDFKSTHLAGFTPTLPDLTDGYLALLAVRDDVMAGRETKTKHKGD